MLRVSYARVLETPFNENLVIASTGCSIPVIAAIVPPPGVTCLAGPITPGFRNEFHAGLEQAFGKYVVVDGEYVWKYTHNGYDFGVVGATPIAFPIEWTKSKIPGFDGRISVPNFHGFSAYVVMSSVAARFSCRKSPAYPSSVRASESSVSTTTSISTRRRTCNTSSRKGRGSGFNWRYDSGLVAGATPCYNPLHGYMCRRIDDAGWHAGGESDQHHQRAAAYRRSGVPGRVHVQRRKRNPVSSSAQPVPGVTAWV